MKALEELVNGALMTIGRLGDPVGKTMTDIENSLSRGHGEADENSFNNPDSAFQRAASPITDERLPFWTGFVPRGIGQVGGLGVTGVAAYGVYSFVGPWSLVIPAAIGLYSLTNAVYSYAQTIGEPAQNGSPLANGFVHGMHRASSVFLEPFYAIENQFKASGYAGSHIISPVTESAQKLERRITTPIGVLSGIGVTGGTLAGLGYGTYLLAAGSATILAPFAAPIGIAAGLAVPAIRSAKALYHTFKKRFLPHLPSFMPSPSPSTA